MGKFANLLNQVASAKPAVSTNSAPNSVAAPVASNASLSSGALNSMLGVVSPFAQSGGLDELLMQNPQLLQLLRGVNGRT